MMRTIGYGVGSSGSLQALEVYVKKCYCIKNYTSTGVISVMTGLVEPGTIFLFENGESYEYGEYVKDADGQCVIFQNTINGSDFRSINIEVFNDHFLNEVDYRDKKIGEVLD